jgi:outer membrane protein assembly factor BamB
MGFKSKSFAVILVALFLSSLVAFPYLAADADSTADDWSMFRHDSAHTGATSSAGPAQLVKLWSYQEGHFDGYPIGSSAAVVNGIVYVGSNFNQAEYKGGNIYAFDSYRGAKLWNYSTNYGVYSSPAVENNMLFIGADDCVLALDALRGTKIWSFETGSSVRSSPAVINGIVYVGSYDCNVYALNASTGKELWSYATQGEIYSSPAYADGYVYLASDGGNIYAFNALTGIKSWNYTVEYTLSSPCVDNGMLFIGTGKGVYAINASTGEKIWSTPLFSDQKIRAYSSPAVSNGVLYIGSNGGGVYAFNASTGSQIWNNRHFAIVYSSPAISNGVVYIDSAALNATTGAILQNFRTDNTINASPAISNGVLYIASQDGYFYAIGKPIVTPSVISTQSILIVLAVVLAITSLFLLLYRKHRKTSNSVKKPGFVDQTKVIS